FTSAAIRSSKVQSLTSASGPDQRRSAGKRLELWFKSMPPSRVALPSRLFPGGRPLSLLFGDPLVGTGIEKIEGQGAAIEHLVMEAANVELGTQFFLGPFAEFADLK